MVKEYGQAEDTEHFPRSFVSIFAASVVGTQRRSRLVFRIVRRVRNLVVLHLFSPRLNLGCWYSVTNQ